MVWRLKFSNICDLAYGVSSLLGSGSRAILSAMANTLNGDGRPSLSTTSDWLLPPSRLSLYTRLGCHMSILVKNGKP